MWSRLFYLKAEEDEDKEEDEEDYDDEDEPLPLPLSCFWLPSVSICPAVAGSVDNSFLSVY